MLEGGRRRKSCSDLIAIPETTLYARSQGVGYCLGPTLEHSLRSSSVSVERDLGLGGVLHLEAKITMGRGPRRKFSPLLGKVAPLRNQGDFSGMPVT